MPRDCTGLISTDVQSTSCRVSHIAVNLSGMESKKKNKSKAKKSGKNPRSDKGSVVTVAVPVSKGIRTRKGSPGMISSVTPDGRIRVSHREFISDIVNNQVFTVKRLVVNPGLSSSFPWLSSLARMYEFYKFVKLSFVYLPSVGTSTPGTFGMTADYDAFDYAPSLKSEFLMHHGAVRSSIWDKCELKCDTADLRRFGAQRFSRAGDLAPNLDLKMYDVCQLQYAANSGTFGEGLVCGELYVDYVVDLMTPQPAYWPLDDPTPVSAKFTSSSPTLLNLLLGAIKTGGLDVEYNGVGLKFNKTGQFMVEVRTDGTNITNAEPTVNISSGSGGASSFTENVINAAATAAVSILAFYVTLAPAVFVLGQNGHASSVTSSLLRISPYKTSLG